MIFHLGAPPSSSSSSRLEANSRSLSTWVAVGDVQSSTSQLPSPQVFVFQPHQHTMIIFSTSTKCKKIIARHHRCIVDTIIIATNSTAINTHTIHPCNLSTTSLSQFYHHHHCQDKHQYDQYHYHHQHWPTTTNTSFQQYQPSPIKTINHYHYDIHWNHSSSPQVEMCKVSLRKIYLKHFDQDFHLRMNTQNNTPRKWIKDEVAFYNRSNLGMSLFTNLAVFDIVKNG